MPRVSILLQPAMGVLPVTVVELYRPLHPQLVRLTVTSRHPLTASSALLQTSALVNVNHKLVLAVPVLPAGGIVVQLGEDVGDDLEVVTAGHGQELLLRYAQSQLEGNSQSDVVEDITLIDCTTKTFTPSQLNPHPHLDDM